MNYKNLRQLDVDFGADFNAFLVVNYENKIRIIFDDDYLKKNKYNGCCIYPRSISKHRHGFKDTIIVCSSLNPIKKVFVFLHELGHTIDKYTISNKYNDASELYANAFSWYFLVMLRRENIDVKVDDKIININQAIIYAGHDLIKGDTRYRLSFFPFVFEQATIQVERLFIQFRKLNFSNWVKNRAIKNRIYCEVPLEQLRARCGLFYHFKPGQKRILNDYILEQIELEKNR